MSSLPDMQRKYSRIGTLVALGFQLLLTSQVLGQSGRRAPPAQQSSTPAQTRNDNSEAASSKTGTRELKQKVTLAVAKQPTSKHLASESAIVASFLKRLSEFANLSTETIGDLKRSDAILRAKTVTESLVILVQFDIDSFQNGTIILNSPDLDVRVLVFEPKTGREKFKGKVYYKAVGGPMMKKDNWPNGPPIKITTEAVGIEAADQLHDWLLIQDVPQKP
jgi:hypothetical protein